MNRKLLTIFACRGIAFSDLLMLQGQKCYLEKSFHGLHVLRYVNIPLSLGERFFEILG